jgi:putative lipoprotein
MKHVAALLLALSVGSSVPARAQEAAPWWGPDKALHFSVSAALAGGGYGVTAAFTDDVRLRLGIGGGVALSLGIAKELWDLSGHGSASWKDFTWDVIGVATGLLLSWLVDRYLVTPLLGEPADLLAIGRFVRD